MKRTPVYVSSFLAIFVSCAALGIGAAVDLPSTLMSRADYAVAKKGIEADARMALAQCRQAEGAERDVCKAEARAGERVKLADLDSSYHGTVAAAEKARQVHERAAYDVSKARCVSRVGEERVECLRTARQPRIETLAEAKPATT